jgi:hypothetical protein
MTKQEKKIDVTLYIRGDDLNPEAASRSLGVRPTRSQRKGERKVTSSGCEFVTKTGLWSITSPKSNGSLSENLKELASIIGANSRALKSIPGAQEVYLDVFIGVLFDAERDASCEFELTKADIEWLSDVSIPIRFSVSFSDD